METTRRIWTKEADDKIKRLFKQKLSTKQVAYLMGVTGSSINNRCKKLGIKRQTIIPCELKEDSLALREWIWENRIAPKLIEKLDSCLEWPHAHYRHGYGQVRVDKTTILQTHRVAYEVRNRVVLNEKQFVCHKCDNPKCCNPNHLFVGTYKDNSQDMMQKGRGGGQFKPGHISTNQLRGSQLPCAKFTESEVRIIRQRHIDENIGHKRLAKEYGVAFGTMRCILRRKTWKHVL